MTPTCDSTPRAQDRLSLPSYDVVLMAAPETCLRYEDESWWFSDYPIFVQIMNKSPRPLTFVFPPQGPLLPRRIEEALSVGEVLDFGPNPGGPPAPDAPPPQEVVIGPGDTWASPVVLGPLGVTLTSVLEGVSLQNGHTLRLPDGTPRLFRVTMAMKATILGAAAPQPVEHLLTAEIRVIPANLE